MDILKKIWDFLNTPPPEVNLIPLSSSFNKVVDNNIINGIYNAAVGSIRFLERIILTTPTIFLKTQSFWKVYKVMVMLSLSILALAIMVISILKVSGKEFDIESIKNKLIAYPFVVILGPYFLIKFVDIFNRISSIIINTDGMVLPDNFSAGFAIGVIISMSVFAILSYKLVFFYGKRMIKIILFAVTLPIIFVFWCLPSHPHIITQWIDDVFSLLMSQVVHAIIFLIIGSIVIGAAELNSSLIIVYQIGALGVMNEVEDILARFTGGREKMAPGSWSREIKKTGRRIKGGREIYKKSKGVIKWVLKK